MLLFLLYVSVFVNFYLALSLSVNLKEDLRALGLNMRDAINRTRDRTMWRHDSHVKASSSVRAWRRREKRSFSVSLFISIFVFFLGLFVSFCVSLFIWIFIFVLVKGQQMTSWPGYSFDIYIWQGYWSQFSTMNFASRFLYIQLKLVYVLCLNAFSCLCFILGFVADSCTLYAVIWLTFTCPGCDVFSNDVISESDLT